LVLRPLPSTNVTPAAIFRVIEAHRPTLLIDEADTFLYHNDELRRVLNGNRKGSTVLRTVGDDHEPRAFATYSACAVALIGALPDTLHDRSVSTKAKAASFRQASAISCRRSRCRSVLASLASRSH
jgi:putative DNA primase/helicase